MDELYESKNEYVASFEIKSHIESWAMTDPTSENTQNEEEEQEKDPEEMFNVLILLRSFLKFLNSHVISTTTIACSSHLLLDHIARNNTPFLAGICQNHCLILYVFIGDVADAGGVLTFYIPAVLPD